MSMKKRCKVQTAKGWVNGQIVGKRAGDVDENFLRLDVKTDDGKLFEGCHPECVREI